MKKTEEELRAILTALRNSYFDAFGHELPSDLVRGALDDYILSIKKKFIQGRIDGLDGRGAQYLLHVCSEGSKAYPVEPLKLPANPTGPIPIPIITEVKKRGRPPKVKI